MSDEQTQTTQTGAPPPEVVAAGEAERARRDEQIAGRLRESWGNDDSGVFRALAVIDIAKERLGISDEAATELEHWMGVEVATEIARKTGESLAMLDAEMTVAEARERLAELKTDRAFYERLEAGDRVALKVWDGLTSLVAFSGGR